MVNWLATGASFGIGYGTALAALKAGEPGDILKAGQVIVDVISNDNPASGQ